MLASVRVRPRPIGIQANHLPAVVTIHSRLPSTRGPQQIPCWGQSSVSAGQFFAGNCQRKPPSDQAKGQQAAEVGLSPGSGAGSRRIVGTEKILAAAITGLP